MGLEPRLPGGRLEGELAQLGSFERSADADAFEMGPQGVGLDIDHDLVRVRQQTGGLEIEHDLGRIGTLDPAVEQEGGAAERAEHDRDRGVADRVVGELVVAEDSEGVGHCGPIDLGAENDLVGFHPVGLGGGDPSRVVQLGDAAAGHPAPTGSG